MIHKVTKWPVVWGTTYNDVVKQLDIAMRTLSNKRQSNLSLEERNRVLDKSLRHEQQKRNDATQDTIDANKRADKQTEISDKN